jgi:hypothetical protein
VSAPGVDRATVHPPGAGPPKPDEFTYHPEGDALQDLGYDYDLVGNILAIRDRAPGSGILNNPEAATTSDPVLAQLLIRRQCASQALRRNVCGS